jgi:hypothetical protein
MLVAALVYAYVTWSSPAIELQRRLPTLSATINNGTTWSTVDVTCAFSEQMVSYVDVTMAILCFHFY